MSNSCPHIRECIIYEARRATTPPDKVKASKLQMYIEDEKCPKTRAKGQLSETCWKVGKR